MVAQEPSDRVALDVTLPGTNPLPRKDPAEPLRGDVVGRFVILSELGRGGMGVVYSAYDPELERRVAVKMIASLGVDPGERHLHTLHEAKALARLSHANIVGVYDVGLWCDRVWLAMELVDGSALHDWLKEGHRNWREIVKILCAAGDGLKAAHAAGIVHGDFKPENVMIDANDRVRVVDFGLAHGPEGLSIASMIDSSIQIQGTPAYMSPEQHFRRAERAVLGSVQLQRSRCTRRCTGCGRSTGTRGTSLKAAGASGATCRRRRRTRGRRGGSSRCWLRGLATRAGPALGRAWPRCSTALEPRPTAGPRCACDGGRGAARRGVGG
jgi:predicted Ser/Thr protein kinase